MWQSHCRKCKKKNYFGNCGNPIADNAKKKKKKIFWQLWQSHCRKCKKKKKKKIILAIVAMPLPKMEKKNYEICERVKKKKVVMYTIF